MDINNLEQQESTTPKQIVVTDEAISYLTETHKWTKFLSIVGFVSIGLLVLVAVFFMVGYSSLESFIPESQQTGFPGGGFSGIGFGISYILLAALYFFPLKYMYTFSTSLKSAIEDINTDSFTFAMLNLKSLNKFFGIFTIVFLSIYALIFVFGILAASMFM